jgi:hypothetical protein
MIKLERGTCFSRNTSILPSSIFLPWQHHIFLRQFYNLIKIKNIHQNITIDFQKHALTVYGITAAYMSFSPATTNMLPLCNPRPIPIQPCPSCHGKAVDSCGGWCHLRMYSSTRDTFINLGSQPLPLSFIAWHLVF